MIYEIPSHVATQLKEFFNQFDFIDKVVVFGSRARHDCTPKSDIDLCIYSLEMTDIQFSKLKSEIDELPILYKLDVVHFEKVNKELQDNVERDGKLLFQPKYKLKDIATYINGKAFKPTEWSDNGLPIIRIQNLTNLKKEFNYYDKEVDDKYIIELGDILISWSATLGVFEWKREKAVLNQHIFKVVFDKNIKVDKKYFIWAIQNILEHFEQYTHGSTMKHITKSNFDNVELYFPTLTKQKKIANILDKASELITLRKESIEKLDELSKSIFIDMFGDPISNPKKFLQTKLLNIIKLQRGFDLPKNERDLDGKFELYTANGLTSKHNRAKVFGGGVITGRSGTIGKVFYTKNDFWPLNTTLFSIKTYGNNIIFLCYLLRFIKLDNYSESSSVPTLNRNIIHELNVIDVPKTLQTKFATIIEKIEEQKALYEKELKLLENNFDSLLDESFN